MSSRPPGFRLERILRSSLHQDWMEDFSSPYDAVENWFVLTGEREENDRDLIADIDLLFAETSGVEERMARLKGIYVSPSDLDPLLRAMRQRAVDGLAGSAQPMRAP